MYKVILIFSLSPNEIDLPSTFPKMRFTAEAQPSLKCAQKESEFGGNTYDL